MWTPGSLALALALAAQAPQVSTSSIAIGVKDGAQTVEIANTTYEVAGKLVLRKSTRSKQVLDEIGLEASTTVEAWRLGADLKGKPLYSVTAQGTECRTVDDALLVFSRGLEEVDWWSVHKLSNGARLFDTYTPLVGFSIARDVLTRRYAGLEVPPDDVSDARLREPHVVAVLSYASAERVIREALITCDDVNQAAILRSYADAERSLTVAESRVRLSISRSYPSPPAPITLLIPIVRDDLDLAHVQAPPKIHIAAWKR